MHIPIEVLIGVGGGILGLLLLIHLVLLVTNLNKLGQYKSLEKKWEEIQPRKAEADEVIAELRKLQGKVKSMEEITLGSNILWARKLNILSDQLPRGVWLKRAALNGRTFFIEGSAISRDQKEIISVHNFTAALKKQQDFLKDFDDLELDSVQRRKIKDIEVADFLITIQLK